MKKWNPAWLLGLGLAAVLAAGCSGTVYFDGPVVTRLQVTNTTGTCQYVYLDGAYVGWVAPYDTVTFEVCGGWHHVEAFEDDALLISPIVTDCYCFEGLLFCWLIMAMLDAPPSAPEPASGALCPDQAEPPSPAAPAAIPASQPEMF
jgi:hypothetical protein